MPHGSLVGAIVRAGEVIIPDRASVVEVGDRVVLFARPALLPRLQRLIAAG
jgi:trk system potassium uptake protein TrkA